MAIRFCNTPNARIYSPRTWETPGDSNANEDWLPWSIRLLFLLRFDPKRSILGGLFKFLAVGCGLNDPLCRALTLHGTAPSIIFMEASPLPSRLAVWLLHGFYACVAGWCKLACAIGATGLDCEDTYRIYRDRDAWEWRSGIARGVAFGDAR
jgi:hypothetical protein